MYFFGSFIVNQKGLFIVIFEHSSQEVQVVAMRACGVKAYLSLESEDFEELLLFGIPKNCEFDFL